jgi:arogenate dehydrogenase (NADP+)
VVQAIAPHWSNFVGGHPMAGTSESGIEAAQYDLFVDRPYVLTPTPETPETATKQVEELIRPLQVRLVHCQPEEHDRAVAWISHLPVMISASLIAACTNEPDSQVLELAKALASSGFRDTSRVGGGNPELGTMMAQYNTAALVRSLHAYRATLDQFISQVEQQNWETLKAALSQNQQIRPSFLKE